jgi:hypothetical protein
MTTVAFALHLRVTVFLCLLGDSCPLGSISLLQPANQSPTAANAHPSPNAGSSSAGLILSPASDPIPSRLVRRIQAGEFIEMRELLADNISLYNRSSELQGISPISVLPPSLRPQIREVPSLISWVYCFAAYTAVRTQDPLTRDMLSYARLIIREALRHGGRGWQEYDRSFRRQLAIDTSQPWNVLNPSLQASTLVGSGVGPRTWCSLCHEPDHSLLQCALASLQQGVTNIPTTSSGPRHMGRYPLRPQPRPETRERICVSWNYGFIIYPATCVFRHVCAVCKLEHKAISCPSAPENSPYRRKALRRPPVTRALPTCCFDCLTYQLNSLVDHNYYIAFDYTHLLVVQSISLIVKIHLSF